jgi:hypothetical protein
VKIASPKHLISAHKALGKLLVLVVALAIGVGTTFAESGSKPWMNKAESAEIRSQQLLSVMTITQKFQQLVGAAGTRDT